MDGVQRWTVVIDIRRVESITHAEAHLHQRDADHLTGQGTVIGEMTDERAPRIGEALATARTLTDLAEHLRRTATEHVTGPVRPLR
ncbi:dsRBD fold-containing protein [Pseudonocardia sp. CA-107938]|uniref:dsRBD fold-containing protein n=1 Tax=Pseudonocardia sp. CA-107938 TaxID=3240021 RepID=UPI003D8C6A27